MSESYVSIPSCITIAFEIVIPNAEAVFKLCQDKSDWICAAHMSAIEGRFHNRQLGTDVL